jgi:hypothetical protein
MAHRIISVVTDEPVKRQVVLQLLDQLLLGAEGIDRLKQQVHQQLPRYRGHAALGIHPAEGGVETIQCLIRLLPPLPQVSAFREPLLRRDVGPRRTVPSCWPRIRTVPLWHSPADGW